MASYKGEARKLRRALGSFKNTRVIDKDLLADVLAELLQNDDYRLRKNIENLVSRYRDMRLSIARGTVIDYKLRSAKELKSFDFEKLFLGLDIHHTLRGDFILPLDVTKYGSRNDRLIPSRFTTEVCLIGESPAVDRYAYHDWQYMWAIIASLVMDHRDYHDAQYLLSDGRTNYFFVQSRGGWEGLMPVGIFWDIVKENWRIKEPNARIPADSRVFQFI